VKTAEKNPKHFLGAQDSVPILVTINSEERKWEIPLNFLEHQPQKPADAAKPDLWPRCLMQSIVLLGVASGK
jgi:hypothetical protein